MKMQEFPENLSDKEIELIAKRVCERISQDYTNVKIGLMEKPVWMEQAKSHYDEYVRRVHDHHIIMEAILHVVKEESLKKGKKGWDGKREINCYYCGKPMRCIFCSLDPEIFGYACECGSRAKLHFINEDRSLVEDWE